MKLSHPCLRLRFRTSFWLLCAAVLTGSLLPIQRAAGVIYYWNTATGTWQTGANWSDNATSGGTTGVVPLSTDSVVFNQSSLNGNETISLNAATGIAGITFNNTGTTTVQSDSVTSRVLTLGTGGITVAATAGAVTIGNATNGTTITLGGVQTWTNNSTTNAVTIQNLVTNAGNALTLGGAGTFVFNTGFTSTVAAGSVAMNIGTGAGSGTTVNFLNSATSTNSVLGDFAINGGKLIYNGGSQTTANALGIGSGTVYRQVLLSNGGTFQVSTTDFNDNVVSTTNKGAGFVFNIGTGGGTFSVDSGRVFTLDDGTGAGTASTNSQLQGSGNLTKTGLGVLSLGNSTVSNVVFTGQILVTQGVLRTNSLTTGVGFGATSANTVISSGAALDLGVSTSTSAEPVTISGTGAGALALYNAAAGNGTNSIYSSGATASSFAGPITLAAPSTIGAGAAGTMTLSGGVTGAFDLTINNLNAGGTTFSTAAVNNGGTITNSGTGAGTTTISSVGAGVTNVIQNSATSQLTLSSTTTNAYTGTTTVSAGTLSVAGVSASGSGPLGTSVSAVGLSGGGTLNFTNASPGAFFRNFTIGTGGGVLSVTGTGTAALAVTPTSTGLTGGTVNSISLANGPLTLTTGATAATNYMTLGNATFNTALFTGTNALNKLGGGTATLTTTGGTVVTAAAMPINIQAGTLQYTFGGTNAQTNTLLGTGPLSITPGATLGLSVGSFTDTLPNTIAVPNTSAGISTISTSGGITFTSAATVTFAAGSFTPTLRLTNLKPGGFRPQSPRRGFRARESPAQFNGRSGRDYCFRSAESDGHHFKHW